MEYYLQTNLFCLILLIGAEILIYKKNSLTPVRRTALSRLIRYTMLVCVSDAFAWIFMGKETSAARLIGWISNILYYISLSVVCYMWLIYVDASIQSVSYQYKRNKWLTAIPLLAIILLALSTPFTHILFSMDEHNVYARGTGIIFHWIVSWGYLLFASAVVVVRIHKSKTRSEKHQMYPMLVFAVMPAVAAIFQMLFYGVTATQCGITISIMLIIYEDLQVQISKDALTGLNNRAAFDAFVDEQLQRQNRTFSVMMCDVDKFKSINDGYGHVMGDYVLKSIANALKAACGKMDIPIFLCRYGGDEFLFCVVDIKKEKFEALQPFIHEELKRSNKENPISISLGISVGLASRVCNSESDVEKLIKTADETMYANKRQI